MKAEEKAAKANDGNLIGFILHKFRRCAEGHRCAFGGGASFKVVRSTAFRLVVAGFVLSWICYAGAPTLKEYLGLSESQRQELRRLRLEEVQRRIFERESALVARSATVLTEAQKAQLPALEEALRLRMARYAAAWLGLIDVPRQDISCSCEVYDRFYKWLGLSSGQIDQFRRGTPEGRLSSLTPEQRGRLDGLRKISDLEAAADEAGRLWIVADPLPHYECLCP